VCVKNPAKHAYANCRPKTSHPHPESPHRPPPPSSALAPVRHPRNTSPSTTSTFSLIPQVNRVGSDLSPRKIWLLAAGREPPFSHLLHRHDLQPMSSTTTCSSRRAPLRGYCSRRPPPCTEGPRRYVAATAHYRTVFHDVLILKTNIVACR
jgi:hypothetical protein